MYGKISLEKFHSDKFMKLGSDYKKHYLLKIATIDDIDLCTLKGSDLSENVSILPPLR